MSVLCGAPCPLSGGGGSRLAAEDGEGHSLTRPSHLSIPSLRLSLACTCVRLWTPAWAGTVSTITHTSFYLISTSHTHTSSSQHSADFTLKLVDLGGRPVLTPPCDSPVPPSLQRDPPPALEYWPKLSPWPTPLTPLGVRGSMAGQKVQMIFLHLPPSCCPTELIANDNIRKGHNGYSTNNLDLRFANLNICRSYKRVMDGCFVCVCTDSKVKTKKRRTWCLYVSWACISLSMKI